MAMTHAAFCRKVDKALDRGFILVRNGEAYFVPSDHKCGCPIALAGVADGEVEPGQQKQAQAYGIRLLGSYEALLAFNRVIGGHVPYEVSYDPSNAVTAARLGTFVRRRFRLWARRRPQ